MKKITADNNVKNIIQSEQTKKGDSRANTTKNKSYPRKQNKKISQILKKNH